MKTEKGLLFEEGDDVEACFIGRRFKKVPKEGEEPCVFAYTKACDVICVAKVCSCRGRMWAEDVSEKANKKSSGKTKMKPLVRCRHCGKFCDSGTEVGVGSGKTEIWCGECAAEDSQLCPKCGRHSVRSAFSRVTGVSEEWCESCCDEHTFLCSGCGHHSLNETAVAVITADGGARAPVTVKWCRGCVNTKSAHCTRCGRVTDRRMSSAAPHDPTHFPDVDSVICPECMRDLGASQCRNCGRMTLNPANSRGEAYCDECLTRGYGSPVYSYHRFCGKLCFWEAGKTEASRPNRDTLYLGFELEAGGTSPAEQRLAASEVNAIDPGETRFHLEQDGSIPSFGFELISSPHTYAAHREYDWKKVLKAMIRHKMKSHDLDGQCGLHVHVSRSFLSGPDMAKIDLFVLKNRVFWERIARRASTRYSQFVTKPIRYHGTSNGDAAGRYAAVNFTNSNTVEFRLFRGTLNYDTLIGTLAIVDGLCRWIKTRNCVQILNPKETETFYNWLKAGGAEYAPAVAYIDKRNALSTDGEI